MSVDASALAGLKPVLEIKSSTFSVPVLLIHKADLPDIKEKITNKLQQAPEFFKNSPLFLDIHTVVAQNKPLNLEELIKFLRAKNLIPIGLRGGNAEYEAIALKAGLFIQPLSTTAENDKALTTGEPKSTVPPHETSVASAIRSPIRAERRVKNTIATSKIITMPVRSGQRVYSEGDLIVMAQVSAGAEIMAEGNIHVYSSLRGRALAGVLGKPDSRIFCFDCQAELIAIAGNYKLNEDLDPVMQHKPVQIYLQDQALIVKEL